VTLPLYDNSTVGVYYPLMSKYHLNKSEKEKLYDGVVTVSSFILLPIVLLLWQLCCKCKKKLTCLQGARDKFLLFLGVVVPIGCVVFAAIFSRANKPFAGFGPMRKRREDLLFKPMLPLAGYCDYNFSTHYNSSAPVGESVPGDDGIEYLAFHQGITLITVVLFTSLILPEVGFAKFRDPNEDAERIKRGSSELGIFCKGLNPCAASDADSGAKQLLKRKGKEKIEQMKEKGESLQSDMSAKVCDEEPELPDFYASGVLGNFDKVLQTLELVIQATELRLGVGISAQNDMQKAAGQLKKHAGKPGKTGMKLADKVNLCTRIYLNVNLLLLTLLKLVMQGCNDFVPVLTSAGQIVAFVLGVCAYYQKSIGGSPNWWVGESEGARARTRERDRESERGSLPTKTCQENLLVRIEYLQTF
jgi:hypothetical protein